MVTQSDLFGSTPALPEGFRYQAALIDAAEERALVDEIKRQPFKAFQFHGFEGKRRVVSFGWRYDFNERVLQKADDIPAFVLPVRAKAASFADLLSEQLQQVLLTEYEPGASIGWHRDKPMFDDVIGISLVSSCRFRFRREADKTWERISLTLEPRSVYLMRGPARTEWEHSIPAVDQLRYSITFRNFREDFLAP